MQKITPFLWYDTQAEEAAQFYVSLFDKSEIKDITRYGESGPGPKGTVMSVTFRLAGQDFIALNGGPMFSFSPAVSFFVNCKTQKEIDALWDKLSNGGEEQQCGWVKDKFGLSWQIVPDVLAKLGNDPDPIKAKRVFDAMLKMKKLDIEELKRAYDGQ